MLEEFPAIDKLMEEITRLQKSHELLEELYLSIGSYNLSNILNENPYDRDNLSLRINNHFGFDDSE